LMLSLEAKEQSEAANPRHDEALSVTNEELLRRTEPTIEGNIHGDIQSPLALAEGFEVAMGLQLSEANAYFLLAASLYHYSRGDQERSLRNLAATPKRAKPLYNQAKTMLDVLKQMPLGQPFKRILRDLFDLLQF